MRTLLLLLLACPVWAGDMLPANLPGWRCHARRQTIGRAPECGDCLTVVRCKNATTKERSAMTTDACGWRSVPDDWRTCRQIHELREELRDLRRASDKPRTGE